MKRFYKLVSTKKTADGWVIQLDGKTVKTPSGQELAAPSRALGMRLSPNGQDRGIRLCPPACR
jgi:chaperone required for assembly of F1-ATPase